MSPLRTYPEAVDVATIVRMPARPSSRVTHRGTAPAKSPTHAAPHADGFCALVARLLRCRRCSLMLPGDSGQLIVEDGVGLPTGIVGAVGGAIRSGVADSVARTHAPLVVNERTDRGNRPAASGYYATKAFISYPLLLPDGTTGAINVTEREDESSFGADDLALLGQLAGFYVSTFDVAARREVLRLRAELRRLRAASIRTQEAERQRLARELHDDAGHALTGAILRLDMAGQTLIGSGPLTEAIGEIRGALTECADHLHDLAFSLRPRLLTDLGLAPALRALARRARAASGLSIEVNQAGAERRLDEDVELTAFRIAQEATTNALKHAHASN
ncbi:MAG: histidine kinase, partial [Chloroflexota bacterium]|nr:histidine kinase [Chloroflexota bacterium]